MRRRTVVTLAVAVGLIGVGLWQGAANGRSNLVMVAMNLHAPDMAFLYAAPPQIKIHLTAALISLAIGIVLLSGVKGTRAHRALGWTWVLSMGVTAISSFFIHEINRGGLSFIHFLSGWTVIALPAAVFAIKRRKVAAHARAMTGMFVGGLILAGLLAFLPGRLMWNLFLA